MPSGCLPGARTGASWSLICLFSLVGDITLSLPYFWPQRLQNGTSWVVSCVPCKIPVGFNIFMVHNQSFRILTITSLLRVWEHSKQSCFQREGKYLCTKPSDLLKNVELPPLSLPLTTPITSKPIHKSFCYWIKHTMFTSGSWNTDDRNVWCVCVCVCVCI